MLLIKLCIWVSTICILLNSSGWMRRLTTLVSLRVLFSAVWISLMILYHLFLVSLLVIGNNKT